MSKYIVVHGIRIAKDFVPETFGRLTTIGPRFMLPSPNVKDSRSMQVCQCDCGNVVLLQCNHLVCQHTKSCGCLRPTYCRAVYTEHGMTKSSEYRIWCQIRNRCQSEKNQAYPNYGGRGIKVCDRWSSTGIGFLNFYADMGPRPSADHSIDRIDNNGNYCPENCRWATRKEQARNRKSNNLVRYKDRIQCVTAWAEEYGISEYRLSTRLKQGMPIEDAIASLRTKGNP